MGANHDTAALMSHDDATKYAYVVFDEGGVKWTHNPKLHRLKRFGQIDRLMSFYWHACHLLMHDDHDLDGHLY